MIARRSNDVPEEIIRQGENSKADVEAAMRNFIRRGLVVAREDVNGKVSYFPTECAPPLEPFELECRSELPVCTENPIRVADVMESPKLAE
jgi:hypothetical protein